MNILVVDDHPLYRSGVVYTLQNTGLDVSVVECAALDTAFARLDEGLQADLMILDLQMPGYTGLDSVRAVRSRRPEVPVLVLSGNEDPAVVRECIDLGAFGFVPKSAPSDQFNAALTLVLGSACLASLGVAVASLVKDADQAMPVAQLTFLPVSFISGIWFPLDGAPGWLVSVAHFFPLSHIVTAFGSCFTPGRSFHAGDLVPIAIWTVAGLFVAVRRFRFEP